MFDQLPTIWPWFNITAWTVGWGMVTIFAYLGWYIGLLLDMTRKS